MVTAAYGASIARQAVADSLHCSAHEWKRDTFPTAPEAQEISVTELMKLHLIQIHLARRLS